MDKKPKDLIYFDEAVEFPKHIKAMEDKIRQVIEACERLCPQRGDSYRISECRRLEAWPPAQPKGYGLHVCGHWIYINGDTTPKESDRWDIFHSLLSLGVQSPAPDENGLLPCAHCGESGYVRSIETEERCGFEVYCYCGASVKAATEGESKGLWNARANAPIAAKGPQLVLDLENAKKREMLLKKEIDELKRFREKSSKLIGALEEIKGFAFANPDFPCSRMVADMRRIADATLAAYKGKEGGA